ncbi:MAG: hypothetical protein MZW92_26235 [Comamonadaceae bacterium]|nr:hypothetical protein [Comamonadaceae bacterium]
MPNLPKATATADEPAVCEGPSEALLASTSVLMAVYAALGRCATTARGAERGAVLARIVDNLALVDSGNAVFTPPVRESVETCARTVARTGVAPCRRSGAHPAGGRGRGTDRAGLPFALERAHESERTRMDPSTRLQPQRSEWLRRERRLDAIAAVLLCSVVGVVCWALPYAA